jgi:methionyl-tRNA synthetase
VNKFYITTAIDYTNEVIHIGHIYQKIIADTLARYHRLQGEDVFFLTGTDEHGTKAEKAAEEAGFPEGREKEFVDQIAEKDKKEQESVKISFDRFIRTTDPDHQELVVKFWKKVAENGDIYLGEYEGIYCDGCESYLTKTELVDGKCPLHPVKEPKKISEKNYFFRLSKYTDFLKGHFARHPEFVWPEERSNEMIAFINQELQDTPISRCIKWGIPVPGDPSQTIYVWFDALINYLSGAPEKYWPADIHVLGKDNTRFHAILWPAMLKSAGYPMPKTILVNGYLTLNGKKISKSIGNVIKASELAAKYGPEAIRYYLLSSKPIETDGDVNLDKLREVYQADLANGLGNLVARVARLCETAKENFSQKPLHFSEETSRGVKNYQLNEVLRQIWGRIAAENRRINQEKPWELKEEKLRKFLELSVGTIRQIAFDLQPFMPETAEKIISQFEGPTIKSAAPLFPRL